jgi:hypothetical protein
MKGVQTSEQQTDAADTDKQSLRQRKLDDFLDHTEAPSCSSVRSSGYPCGDPPRPCPWPDHPIKSRPPATWDENPRFIDKGLPSS